MRSLPPPARIFLYAVYAAAACVLALVGARSDVGSVVSRWEFWLYVVLAALAGGKKVRLFGKLHNSDSGSMSVGYAIAFAAILRYGPVAGALVSMVSCLSSCVYPKRQPLHQLFFNVSVGVVEGWLAGTVYNLLNDHLAAAAAVRTFCAAAAGSVCYFLVNTVAIATIIALITGQRAFKVWTQNFVWTAPSYFAGACACALAMMLLKTNAEMVILFISPVLFFTYRSYSIYVSRAEEKQHYIEELANLYLATIKSLALAIDAKDQYTHQHILRVQRYAVAVAKAMKVDGDDLEGLNTGALLHDIGKLGVPEYVLLKPGHLTSEEFDKIKKHPEIGADILGPVQFPWPVLPVVKHHHEKWDGTGYPDGLSGENIPLTARILAVADVYDALTSNRSYRAAWAHERAVEEIKSQSGIHFDPSVVDAFLSVIDETVAEMKADHAPDSRDAGVDEHGHGLVVSSEAKAERAARHIQRATSELWALYEVAQTLSSMLGVSDMLQILSKKLEAILPGTACVFMLCDDSAPGHLVANCPVGPNSEFLRDARTINDDSVSWKVLTVQESYCGPYSADDLIFSGQQSQWIPLQSMVVVPLIHQGDALGTINLYHPMPEAFSEHDVQLLEAIAERASMALHNGIIYERTSAHAVTDPLTGLYNVRFVTKAIEERCLGTTPFAILCLDLDSFKPVNDNFGHLSGDKVLRDLSDIFRSMVREHDIVARYGGDEFLIVMEGGRADTARALAEKLEQAVVAYDTGLVHDKLGKIRLGVSIGVADFPDSGGDCAALISASDSDMYRNKTDRKLSRLMGHATDLDQRQADAGGDAEIRRAA